ncbi:hypothetical protein G3A43_07075 [Paraburkholderia aspalathi]|nr:hypothetical protein [Paraburkholderia aspalathi]MBK3780014.1 hypothetical protein [Paraburkholderia aspalathi]
MSIHLVQIDSDIVEDHFEHGEGKSTGCGYNGETVGKTFPSMADMLGYLSSAFGLSAKETDYEASLGVLTTSRTVADHTAYQNGGWIAATERELDIWRKGAMKLFSENVTICFHTVA